MLIPELNYPSLGTWENDHFRIILAAVFLVKLIYTLFLKSRSTFTYCMPTIPKNEFFHCAMHEEENINSGHKML